MVEGNLNTTNLMLGIMAVVSVFEALLLIAVGYMAFKMYRQTMDLVQQIEQRHVAPLTAKVNTLMTSVDGILVDVKDITSRLNQQTDRVNSAITTTIDRVDETADRMKTSLSYRVRRVVGLVQGLRAAAATLVNGHTRRNEAHA